MGSVQFELTPIGGEGNLLPGWEECPKPTITAPVEGTQNVLFLMQRSDEARIHRCCKLELWPWGDDFEDEAISRGKWEDLSPNPAENMYYPSYADIAQDHPSQRRGLPIECFGENRVMRLHYNREIPAGKDFRGEIEIHGDRLMYGSQNWTINTSHNALIEWYVTDGTKKFGVSFFSDRVYVGGNWLLVQNMAYMIDDVRYAVAPNFPLLNLTMDLIHIGHKYAVERVGDEIIGWNWSTQTYFEDEEGAWVEAYRIADHFDENATLKFGIYISVDGHVQANFEELDKIGVDNFVVPVVPA